MKERIQMILFPAIDLQNGKCVRLIQGDFTQETIYSDSPLDIARQWQTQGAEWLHVVDLNGAKTGHSVNRDVIIELAATMSIPIQVGGGIRTIEAIDDYLEGKEGTEKDAETIEKWFLQTQHKRHLPINLYDDFWKDNNEKISE